MPERAGRWAVLAIWLDGEQEYARLGPSPATGEIATFSKREAKEHAAFMRVGMDDEVQSINVVRAPRARK